MHRCTNSLLDQLRCQIAHQHGIAQADHSGGHSDICHGERVPSEYPGLGREPVADAAWSNRDAVPFRLDDTAPTQAKGEEIGHAEVRPHSPNRNGHSSLAGKTVLQAPNVRGRPTHIHDHRFTQSGQAGGSPDAVRRARGNRENRIVERVRERHEGAVILSQVEVGLDPMARDSRPKGLHGKLDNPDERCIEDGGILTLQQAQRANLVREGERDALPDGFVQNSGGMALMLGVDRGKDGAHRERIHLASQFLSNRAQASLIQWADLATVEFMATGDDVTRLCYL